MQCVLANTMKQINLLDKASKEISTITKKVELRNEGYKKERSNWEKVVIWLEDIQEFKLQKFQAKCPIASLHDKTLYIIKDCIEWRNEALAQGITEMKEILQGFKVINEIIQGDLKWFGKHCTGKEDDSITQAEEVIKEV